MFTIFAMVPMHESRISFHLSVDIISNSHDLLFICIMTFLTCSVVSGENLVNLGTSMCGGSNSGFPSIHCQMSSILFRRYEANSSASCTGVLFGSGFPFYCWLACL